MINDIYQATNSSAFSWMVIIAWPAPELEMFGEKSAWFISWDLQRMAGWTGPPTPSCRRWGGVALSYKAREGLSR